jgi:hypothetical protein
MADGDRQTDGDARGKRHSRIATGCHVFTLLIGSMYVLAFVLAIWTGYLSWIGIAVGASLTVPGVISPLLGLAGRKRLSTVLTEIGVGLTVLTAIVLQVSLLRAKSDRAGNWRPYRFDDVLAAMEARGAVPDAENAAHHYESVFAGIDAEDGPDFLFSGSSLRDEFGERPWKRVDHPQASEWLDSYSKVIDELLAIGRMEQCRWPIRADVYDEYTVPYRKLRRSVLLLMAAGNRELGEKRVAAALAKYFCVIRIADHLHQQPSTVDSLTGFSVEGIAMQMIRHVLVQSDLSGDDIAGIADRLPPAADPWPQEWERLLDHDKLHYMNLMGRLYEVDDEGNVRFVARLVLLPEDERERPVWIPRVYWLMSMPLNPRGLRRIVDSHFVGIDAVVNAGHLPPVAKAEASTDIDDFVKAVCNFYRWGLEMTFLDTSWYLRHRQRLAAGITERRATWLVLGLRRYRNAHGSWPATLDEVSPYVPAEAFVDPIPSEAFVYGREGDGFRLYGRGPDRVDDDGRDRDLSLWPPRVREPAPEPNSQEILKMYEQIYGKERTKIMLGIDSNERR